MRPVPTGRTDVASCCQLDVAVAGSSTNSHRVSSSRIAWVRIDACDAEAFKLVEFSSKSRRWRDGAGKSDQDLFFARVGQLDFRAQHVHRQLFQIMGRMSRGSISRKSSPSRQISSKRQQASLGGAKAGEARTVGLDAADVVGQQVVQENGGIDTRWHGSDRGRQGGHDGAVARREQFVGDCRRSCCHPLPGLGRQGRNSIPGS
jgi:hypothetical protein